MYTSHLFAQINIPEKERYIFLWDVSASLLSYNGNGPNEDEYTQQSLITNYPLANGLWMDLKKGLIKAIDSIETNDKSEIIVIPFYAEPLAVFKHGANSQGKAEIIKEVMNFKYVKAGDPISGKLRTNIVSALTYFENIVKEDCLDYINYLYLYTDGSHEDKDGHTTNKEWNDLTRKITDFDEYANSKGRYIYRFYYLVSDKADPKRMIRKLDDDSRRFWVVDGLVDINHIGIETSAINYNVCDNPSENIKKDAYKTIKLTKDFKSYKGDFIFTPQNDDYYSVECTKSKEDTLIKVKVTPKNGIELPKNHKILVNIKLDKSLKYYYLLNSQILINCINTPERCVSLLLENTEEDKSNGNKRLDLGNTSYYPSFMGKSSQLNCLNFSLSTDFNKFAKQDKACLNVSFADSEGKPLTYTNFKIVVNKSDTLSVTNSFCPIGAEQKHIDLTILPSENTDDYKFKGYLIVSDINNIDRINGEVIYNDEVKILPWEFEHDRKLNPLFKNLLWIFFLLLLLLFAIYLAFKARALFAPHFPAGCKIAFVAQSDTFNTDIDHNFKLSATYVDKCGVLTEDGSNTVATHILRDRYIQKVILSGNEGHMPFQTTIGEKWNGQIIHVTADFFNDLISSIELKPIKNNRGKEDVLVVVKYSNGSVLELKHIEMSKLTLQNTETDSIYIENTKIAIIGKRLKYFNNDSEA